MRTTSSMAEAKRFGSTKETAAFIKAHGIDGFPLYVRRKRRIAGEKNTWFIIVTSPRGSREHAFLLDVE